MIVATSQFRTKNLSTINDFEDHVKWHLDQAAEKKAELIVFPEFFTIELLTLKEHKITNKHDMCDLFQTFAKEYTTYLQELFTKLAAEYQMVIAAGTHFAYHPEDDCCYNTAYLFSPDGQCFEQCKIHPSYEMVYNKSLTTPGKELNVFEINGVKYGIAVCYDNSFPEVARILKKLGAEIILAPSCCLDEWGKNRNTLFAKARATENLVYVINSQIIGGLPFPSHIPYGFIFTGLSGIYGPIHAMVGSPDGVICQSGNNVEEVITGDIDLEKTRTVLASSKFNCNLKDMRPDFYKQYI